MRKKKATELLRGPIFMKGQSSWFNYCDVCNHACTAMLGLIFTVNTLVKTVKIEISCYTVVLLIVNSWWMKEPCPKFVHHVYRLGTGQTKGDDGYNITHK